MKKFAVMITLLCIFGLNQGCAAVSSTTINKEARLKERIEQAYKCFKERKHEDLLEYFIAAKSYDNAERQKGLRLLSLSPLWVDYTIIDVEISGDAAKVKTEITLKVEDKGTSETRLEKIVSFDYWIFTDNDWYISTYGKAW